MTTLAQLADVEALLGRATTAQEQTYIATLLVNASSLARAYMRQEISQVLGDTITLNGTWRTRIQLPQRPVTNVSSVVLRGTAIPIGTYAWDRYGHIDLITSAASWSDFDSQFGTPASIATGGVTNLTTIGPTLSGPAGSTFTEVQSGPSWSGAGTKITITYDHGYATIPGSIVNEVAGMVASQVSIPIGISSEQIGGYKVVYGRDSSGATGGASLALTPSAMATFDRYRIRASSSDLNLPR